MVLFKLFDIIDVRMADILDILIMSIILYYVFQLFRGTRAVQMLIGGMFLVVAWFLFRFTRIGNDVKAVGSGETAARFSGVHTDRVKFLAFVAAGALTGLAAFVNVIKVGSITATAGNQLETQILISLVLGGLPITGGAKVRFSNIIVGTLMYAVLNSGLSILGYEPQVQQLIKGIVFLIFVALTIDRKALTGGPGHGKRLFSSVGG